MIEIDGSQGEGGGQILRTALSLALVTGKSFRISRIRAGRAEPGLKPQHLAAVQAAARAGRARVEGDRQGSRELTFRPSGPPRPGDYTIDIGTAGAATLAAQTLIIPLALQQAPSHLRIIGGTHVTSSPSADFLLDVYLPALRRFGFQASGSYPMAGFYPSGGGLLDILITPGAAPQPVEMPDPGELHQIDAAAITANLPADVAERGVRRIRRALDSTRPAPNVFPVVALAPSPGAAVVLCCKGEAAVAGFSAVGRRGRPMERVADEAVDQYLSWRASGSSCDEHLADQLVLPAVLASGESCWSMPRASCHLETVISVASLFLDVTANLSEAGSRWEVRLTSAGLPSGSKSGSPLQL